jgi:hypothetical protein
MLRTNEIPLRNELSVSDLLFAPRTTYTDSSKYAPRGSRSGKRKFGN